MVHTSVVEAYSWPLVTEFLDRKADLDRLEDWWASDERQPLAMIGRRRVGKSWLFRRFAHGKPAILLVAEQLPVRAQMARFGEQLEPAFGVKPVLPDVATLVRTLYRAARAEKLLVVIDEFPWLLGSRSAQVLQVLSSIQAAIEEERDASRVKLILCGSHVGQMEALFGAQNPMHGRLVRAEVRPVPFQEARQFLASHDPVTAFERYAIAGGMPLYLSRLNRGSVHEAVCSQVLNRDGPLWNEGRVIVEQELREPRVHFGILERLASGESTLNEIAQPLGMEATSLTRYLTTLAGLRIASRKQPVGAVYNDRSGHWQLSDPFLRFWFRFVFPFQAELESSLRPGDLFDNEIAPALASHVAPVFEEWCRQWLRVERGQHVSTVGAWWGKAANRFRRAGERTSEEIDAVGMKQGKVTLVAECKWTTKRLGPDIVTDLDSYKIPALRDAGFKIADDLQIVLFSKSGYSKTLTELAQRDKRIALIDVPRELLTGQR